MLLTVKKRERAQRGNNPELLTRIVIHKSTIKAVQYRSGRPGNRANRFVTIDHLWLLLLRSRRLWCWSQSQLSWSEADKRPSSPRDQLDCWDDEALALPLRPPGKFATTEHYLGLPALVVATRSSEQWQQLENYKNFLTAKGKKHRCSGDIQIASHWKAGPLEWTPSMGCVFPTTQVSGLITSVTQEHCMEQRKHAD